MHGHLLTCAPQGALTVPYLKCTYGGVSSKASLRLGFQPLEEIFRAVSSLPPNDSWNKLNKIMELRRRRAWLIALTSNLQTHTCNYDVFVHHVSSGTMGTGTSFVP